ncbi:putative insecticidal toxin protein [Chitinispirillum alkaliphilum]|nr:putative insecticidal toxin protein [Chitinispirillum alkaliphilum]
MMDDTSRIAIVNHWMQDDFLRETDSPSDLNKNKIRYQYGNHLGSASLELNDTGALISYEEYFPYGGTSFTCGTNQKEVKLKEYRYTGKERDEATGLYYYGARYYAAWIGRWLSADPAGPVDGLNLYEYVRGNPVGLVDPDGRESWNSDDVAYFEGLAGVVFCQGDNTAQWRPTDYEMMVEEQELADEQNLRNREVLGMLNGRGVVMPEADFQAAKKSENLQNQMEQFMNPFGAIGYLANLPEYSNDLNDENRLNPNSEMDKASDGMRISFTASGFLKGFVKTPINCAHYLRFRAAGFGLAGERARVLSIVQHSMISQGTRALVYLLRVAVDNPEALSVAISQLPAGAYFAIKNMGIDLAEITGKMTFGYILKEKLGTSISGPITAMSIIGSVENTVSKGLESYLAMWEDENAGLQILIRGLQEATKSDYDKTIPKIQNIDSE